MKFLETYQGLPKAVYVIFMAQIINRFGDFVLPFLSLLLVSKMGLSFHIAGLAVTAASLSTIPGAFICGKFADHFGRRKTYGIYQALAGLFICLCAFTKNPYVVIGLICGASFFNGGIRPIISAMLTDILEAKDRQVGFSLSYLGINIGVAIGPIVGGFLFTHLIELMFIGDAITSWLAVILVLRSIPETMPTHQEDETVPKGERRAEGPVWKVLLERPYLLLFLCLNTLSSLVYTQSGFSLPMMLSSVFGEKGPSYYGFIMSFNAIIVVGGTFLLTPFIKTFRPLVAIAIGALLYGLGFGMIGLINGYAMFFVSTLVWTIGEIFISVNFGAYVAGHTPQNYRARMNAVTSLSWVVGSVAGTSLMGQYMDWFGIRAVWPLTFVLGLLGAVGLILLNVKEKREMI